MMTEQGDCQGLVDMLAVSYLLDKSVEFKEATRDLIVLYAESYSRLKCEIDIPDLKCM